MTHRPTLYRTGRPGCWASCCCGWTAQWRWTSVVGAHLEFGEHLIGKERLT